jgi:hypothetical protein
MRYLLGAGFLVAAAWLVYAGLGHRRLKRASAGPAPAEENRLQMMGEIVRPMILFALAYVGLKTSLAYLWLDGSRVLSLLDLGGFLVMLAAYGFWLTMKTKPVYLTGAQGAARAEDGPAAEASFAQLPYNARRKLAVQRDANMRAARAAQRLGKVGR